MDGKFLDLSASRVPFCACLCVMVADAAVPKPSCLLAPVLLALPPALTATPAVAVWAGPFMNPAPFSVMDVTPLTRVFRLYRAMGIRHLPVTNIENEVVGILTRKELRTDFSHDLCALHSRHARARAAVWYMAVGLLSSELALLCRY